MRRFSEGAGGDDEENEINLTPMLDVVFIMLIFFIVTASFIKEAGIDVNRPDAPTAERVEDANILIAISPNDEIWIDRRLVDPRAMQTAAAQVPGSEVVVVEHAGHAPFLTHAEEVATAIAALGDRIEAAAR